MSRIATTLSGIERSLLNRLAEANAAATLSSLRMASGAMINSPADDPSAFVRLSGLQSELTSVGAAMTNVTAASSMVTQAQDATDAIRAQLNAIRTELLKDEDGSLDAAERAEAQANIDAAIGQINTLAGTEIDGKRLLDGSADFDVSGRNSSQVAEVRIYSTGGNTITVEGSVDQAAVQASLVYTGAGGEVTDTATFTVTGELGSVEFSVTAADDLSTVAAEINRNSHKTGVTAVADGDDLTLTSVGYGSDAQVRVDVSSGTFIVGEGETSSDSGTDAEVTINGRAYTAAGNLATVSQNSVHYTVELTAGFTGNLDPMTISGNAMTFALSADLSHRATLAMSALLATHLGGPSGRLDQLASGGSLADLGENTSAAIRVVDEALAELTVVEGAVDGFYNASISSASELLSDWQDNLEDAIDGINFVDDAEETTRIAYYQDLASNAVAGLAILDQQRSGIVQLLQQVAGLT